MGCTSLKDGLSYSHCGSRLLLPGCSVQLQYLQVPLLPVSLLIQDADAATWEKPGAGGSENAFLLSSPRTQE